MDHTARLLGTALTKIGRITLITGIMCTRNASSSRRQPPCTGPEDNFLCTEIQICNDMVPLLDTLAAAATSTAAELDYLLSEYSLAKSDEERMRIYMMILGCLVYWEAMVHELNKEEYFKRTLLEILATPCGAGLRGSGKT